MVRAGAEIGVLRCCDSRTKVSTLVLLDRGLDRGRGGGGGGKARRGEAAGARAAGWREYNASSDLGR